MSPHGNDPHTLREEALEELWTAAEASRPLTVDALSAALDERLRAEWPEVVAQLEAAGLVRRDGELLVLSERGESAAMSVIRRHRLAEVLLFNVLDLPLADVEAGACSMEHALSLPITEAVCSFLGHPLVCPHGRTIPPGDCCRRPERRVAPLLRRLADLSPGEAGTVAIVAPGQDSGIDQLVDLGIVPGGRVTLRQHHPSLVVEVDRTLIAIETEVARRIHVRPA